MAIDLARDELMSMRDVCARLPRRPSPSTLWRWRGKGVLVRGQRVRLECVRVGGSWYTTAAAFAKFLSEQTRAAISSTSIDESRPEGRSPEIANQLREAGLLRVSSRGDSAPG